MEIFLFEEGNWGNETKVVPSFWEEDEHVVTHPSISLRSNALPYLEVLVEMEGEHVNA